MATDGPLRRAQAITPFGVGSLVVNKDGVSLIICGLDNWFKPEEREAQEKDLDQDEFRIEEWRLSARLGVKDFRLPPDYRSSFFGFGNSDEKNQQLTIPVLRFPQWHVCQRNSCGRMGKLPLERRRSAICKEINGGECKGRMVQVPLVSICLHGHLRDFPWAEWVHRSHSPLCRGVLSMHQKGTGGLGGIEIRCDGDGCDSRRTLADVTLLYKDGTTYLSKSLQPRGNPFTCKGSSPWLGACDEVDCGNHLLGSLRSSSNIYYSDTRSSIYLPRHGDHAPSALVKLLAEQPLNSLIGLLKAANLPLEPAALRQQHRELLEDYTDEMIKSAVKLIEGFPVPPQDDEINNDDEITFRREEFAVLRNGSDQADLRVTVQDLKKYDPSLAKYFNRIALVETLRETRAFCGFTRIFSETDVSLQDKRKQLWKSSSARDWLPAYVVKGEGVFLELSEGEISKWETDAIRDAVTALQNRYQQAAQRRHLRNLKVTPRLVLLHTLSHLLMRQLTFDCGYSTASLRERLYVSDDKDNPMAGLLIYTAAGDSEGTMGGLVRMGEPGYLEPVFNNAIESARWCSSDPICLEIGTTAGQGPDNCNLAACHSCALLPETACEQFNRFLDRSMLTGTPDGRIKGYFSKAL
jgi:hypothetical protein